MIDFCEVNTHKIICSERNPMSVFWPISCTVSGARFEKLLNNSGLSSSQVQRHLYVRTYTRFTFVSILYKKTFENEKGNHFLRSARG